MVRDILHLQNRIELMKGRTGRENNNIIKKCERQIRNIDKETRDK